MTTELWMLAASAGLTWGLIMLVATKRLVNNGLGWGFGNHETTPELDGWADRAKRASNNMNENLILFAVAVLLIHLAGKTNETTALGAQLFFYGRVAHAVTYIAGIKVVRTLVYGVSIAGIGLMLSVLF